MSAVFIIMKLLIVACVCMYAVLTALITLLCLLSSDFQSVLVYHTVIALLDQINLGNFGTWQTPPIIFLTCPL